MHSVEVTGKERDDSNDFALCPVANDPSRRFEGKTRRSSSSLVLRAFLLSRQNTGLVPFESNFNYSNGEEETHKSFCGGFASAVL